MPFTVRFLLKDFEDNGYGLLAQINGAATIVRFFDSLQVTHVRGPLLEEDHCYPFGLSMAGISDKAVKTQYATNRYRYNGKELQNQEFSDGTGLEEYDYEARVQDPQLGRFQMVDPHSDKYSFSSPYTYGLNNPWRATDPTGMDTYLSGQAAQDAFASLQQDYEARSSGWNVDLSSDRVDQIAQEEINQNGGESDDNFTIKALYPVYETITPSIYGLTRYAQNILGYDNILMRTLAKGNKNRSIAMDPWDDYERGWSSGYSVDEYPVHSSEEGGWDTYMNRPIVTALVPVSEQTTQSKQLSAMYNSGTVKPGDRFVVVPMSSKMHPQYYGYPYFRVTEPNGVLEPGGQLIYAPGYSPEDLLNLLRNPNPSPNPPPFGPGIPSMIVNLLKDALRLAPE